MKWTEHSVDHKLASVPARLISKLESLELSRDSSKPIPVTSVFSPSAFTDMRDHVYADLRQERLGFLLGQAFFAEARNQTIVEIELALPVPSTQASQVHVSMLRESWPTIWKGMARFPDLQLVGWFHSHPGHGVFLSAEDLETQKHWFSLPWQLAIVIDPLSGEFGCFAGEEGARVEIVY